MNHNIDSEGTREGSNTGPVVGTFAGALDYQRTAVVGWKLESEDLGKPMVEVLR